MELYLISIGLPSGAMMEYPTILIGSKGLDLNQLEAEYGFNHENFTREEVEKFIQWLKEVKGMLEATYEFTHFEEPE